jgi:hypothetical protein
MNAFKLFTLLVLLGAGFMACKEAKNADTATVEATENAVPTNSETSTANVLETNKQNMLNSLSGLENGINKEIENFKAQLETVNAEAKAGIKTKIEGLEQLKTKVTEAADKVKAADEASWAAVTSEIEGISYQVKQVLKPSELKLSAKQ